MQSNAAQTPEKLLVDHVGKQGKIQDDEDELLVKLQVPSLAKINEKIQIEMKNKNEK